MAKSKVVSAVGTIVHVMHDRGGLQQMIEKAMQQAVLDANAEGISNDEKNSPEIRRRMMSARQAAKDQFDADIKESKRRKLQAELDAL